VIDPAGELCGRYVITAEGTVFVPIQGGVSLTPRVDPKPVVGQWKEGTGVRSLKFDLGVVRFGHARFFMSF